MKTAPQTATTDGGIDLSRNSTHWPWRTKWRRALWQLLLQPLLSGLPKFASPLRVGALRLMGAKVGQHCTVMPGVKVLMPWNLTMGDWSALGEDAIVYNYAPVTLGPHSVLSQLGHLCTGSHDYTAVDMPLTFEPIDIGREVWLAAGVFVAPGVRVADGVVVGAMSVVTRDLDRPWSVYAGNPCRYIKSRQIKTKPQPSS